MHSPPERGAFEFSIQDDAAFAIKRRDQGDNGPIHVMNREHAHQTGTCSKLMPVGDGVGIEKQILYGEDHPFGRAGGSGRIDDERFVIETGPVR